MVLASPHVISLALLAMAATCTLCAHMLAVRDADAFPRARARRLAIGGVLLVVIIGAVAHLRLLAEKREIQRSLAEYERLGDRRARFLRRARLAPDLYDCTGTRPEAFAITEVDRVEVSGPRVVRRQPASWPNEELFRPPTSPESAPYTLWTAYQGQRAGSPWDAELPEPVHLTLCHGAMERAHQLLSQTGRRSTAIVADPRSGRVLVLADFSPSDDSLHRMLSIHEVRAPGSVAKLYLSAIAWTLAVRDDQLACPKQLLVGKRLLHNAHDAEFPAGGIDKMLEESCNTAASALMSRLIEARGVDSVLGAYSRLGIDVKTAARSRSPRDSALWYSVSLTITNLLAPRRPSVRLVRQGDPWEMAQLAIGQGGWEVSPLHLLQFVSAIANDGLLTQLAIERRTFAPDSGRRIMSTGVAARLRRAMRGVVEHGTASRASRGALAALGLPLQINGKTGTPWREVADPTVAARRKVRVIEDGVFAGMVANTAAQSQPLAIVVFVDGGGPGAALPTVIADSLVAYIASVHPNLVDIAVSPTQRVNQP